MLFIDFDSPAVEEFSNTEIKQIMQKLSHLENEIINNFTTVEQQANEIRNKIDYLENALNRLSKMDWFHTAVGSFVTIASAIGINDSNSALFLQMIKDFFSGFKLLISGA